MTSPFHLVSLWEMVHLQVGRLLGRANRMSSLLHFAQSQVKVSRGILNSPAEFERNRFEAEDLGVVCNEMGLTTTAAQVAQLLVMLDSATTEENEMRKWEPEATLHLSTHLSGMMQCLRYESDSKIVVVMDEAQASMLAPADPHFGVLVRGQFPGAIFDIDEAGTCLALGRSTAAVFHLLRITEMALRAMNLCLNITTTGTTWGSFLTAARDERVRRGPNWSELVKFQDFYARIAAIKDAYRNPTFHEIAQVYTQREAHRIFLDTESFMKEVSTRMDQNGLPLA